jgi:nucleotide-binding universal stress UspA family protein
MVRFDQILCPVDGSIFSERALRHAALLGNWYQGTVTALYAHRPAVAPSLWPEYPAVVADGDTESAEERWITDFVREHGSAAMPIVFRRGFVVPEILQAASDLAADVIVMGTHGAGGLEHLLLGSVAENVLRHAPCPVLTIPRAITHEPASSGPRFHTVACAIDFSVDSQRALDYATSLVLESGGRLVLVHALEQFNEQDPRTNAHYNVPEFRRGLIGSVRERLEALVPPAARTWCAADVVVLCGPAHREILRAARDAGADVIVLGVHGRNAVNLALFGSTTHRLLHQTTCPVLTVPRKARVQSAAA